MKNWVIKLAKNTLRSLNKVEGSVWGFVVNVENDPKFKKGDILKAAGWATPARNQARGNLIDGNLRYGYNGPDQPI